eukprot:scaffold59572_cov14-Tisochrysis_lutea.AAC.1
MPRCSNAARWYPHSCSCLDLVNPFADASGNLLGTAGAALLVPALQQLEPPAEEQACNQGAMKG